MEISSSCFSFLCGEAYHCPTTCDIIKKWLIKCQDDSESANYITANTKDVSLYYVTQYTLCVHCNFQCPKCHVCIEKNGGCNHMVSGSCVLKI